MRKTSKTLAVLLAVLLILTTIPFAAFAADQEPSGTIPGDSTVDSVVLNVVVPTSLNFALDPLELNVTEGSQIASTDYFIINQTAAPVKASFEITAILADGVSLVDDVEELDKDDTGVTDKMIYFAALGATEITANDLVFDYTFGEAEKTDPVGTYSAEADTLVPFSTDEEKASIEFALAKATKTNLESEDEADTLAADNKGVAAFQFYGELNTYADWQASDITVSGAYTLIPLRATTYENYTAEGAFTADGLNQLKQPEPPAPTAFAITVQNDGNGTASADVETAETGATVNLTATPSSGYRFKEWQAVSPAELTITDNAFTMPAEAVTVKAIFEEIPVGFMGEGSTPTSVNLGESSNANATDLIIPFNFGDATGIALLLPSGSPANPEHYSVNKASNQIVLVKSNASSIFRTWSAGEKTLKFTLTGGSDTETEYIITITATT